MAAAAASNNPLVQIATRYVNYIDGLFSEFGYTIVYPNLTEKIDGGIYRFNLLHNETYVGKIDIAPFVEHKHEYRAGPVKNGKQNDITNVLHIYNLEIENNNYLRMGLATTLIFYSICRFYLIDHKYAYVTLDDSTDPDVDIYEKLGFMPLNESTMKAAEKYTTISKLIGVTLPEIQQGSHKRKLRAKLKKKQAKKLGGTRKTRRYRKKQKKTRRYRR